MPRVLILSSSILFGMQSLIRRTLFYFYFACKIFMMMVFCWYFISKMRILKRLAYLAETMDFILATQPSLQRIDKLNIMIEEFRFHFTRGGIMFNFHQDVLIMVIFLLARIQLSLWKVFIIDIISLIYFHLCYYLGVTHVLCSPLYSFHSLSLCCIINLLHS